MNYSVSSWQMKRLASCPGRCGTWQCRPCLLCTPGSVCTINTAAEVTTGPREIRTGCSLSPPTSPSLRHVNTPRRVEQISCTLVHMWLLLKFVPSREDASRCGIDSLSLSPSRAKSITLLDQPQITAAQQLQPVLIPPHVHRSPLQTGQKEMLIILRWLILTDAKWHVRSSAHWNKWLLIECFVKRNHIFSVICMQVWNLIV